MDAKENSNHPSLMNTSFPSLYAILNYVYNINFNSNELLSDVVRSGKTRSSQT